METAIVLEDWSQTVETLYRQESDRLWRAIYAFAADPDIASEAVADAYAQALRRGPAVRDPAAWIWRASFRIAAGALKARRAEHGQPSTGLKASRSLRGPRPPRRPCEAA